MNPDLERWRGMIALVTGGSSGIGQAIALDLGRLGLRVAVTGRSLPRLEQTCAALRELGATNLTEGSRDYPTADAATRRAIVERHRTHALGLMYFLQNDPAVPAGVRARASEWGLAVDEFAATELIPPLYVREARRLVGRSAFTEHDALLAPGLARAPVCATSVAITEFSLDSLACTMERKPGTLCDGQLFQMEASRPGQIGFGTMLPRTLDNLLVVNPVAATHVGWGAVRQTPTLMHLAESAGWTLVLAARAGCPPAELALDTLQRHLVGHGIMLSFFNDLDMASREPWLAAVQYLGTKGFFPSYDARPAAPLTAATGRRWVDAVPALAAARHDAMALARTVFAAENAPSPVLTRAEFLAWLGRPGADGGTATISRGEACQLCYEAYACSP